MQSQRSTQPLQLHGRSVASATAKLNRQRPAAEAHGRWTQDTMRTGKLNKRWGPAYFVKDMAGTLAFYQTYRNQRLASKRVREAEFFELDISEVIAFKRRSCQ